MSRPAKENHDKTIVQRRTAHADDMSRQAVKNIRAGLGAGTNEQKANSTGFTLEILQHHARLQKTSLIANLLLFGIALALASLSIPYTFAIAWLLAGLLVLGLSFKLTQTFLKAESDSANTDKWESYFLLVQFGFGAVWAGLFIVHPTATEDGTVSILGLSAAMVICAVSLLQNHFLRFGVFLSSFPPSAVVASELLNTPNFTTAAAAVLLAATVYFFHRLGNILRESRITHLNSRAERDQLVMELEASRSISEEARRRAEEANLAKSRFLATMSHELRTPLNAILGFSEIMTNEVMGPVGNDHYKEYLGDIHRSGSHLLKLINEILDLSRVEAGRYELNEEPTNLAHAAEESHQMIKLKAAQKNVAVVMQLQPDLPQLWADARAVRQVILNLLSNALKFTPARGTIWLKVGWTAGGGQYISIRDTGPGIPEEEIPIVLSSFGQGSIAIKSAEQGTGLGLPIVQALVHMHDGHFDLKSKLREGTEVIAAFPKSRVMEIMPAMPVDNQPDAKQQSAFTKTRREVDAPALAG